MSRGRDEISAVVVVVVAADTSTTSTATTNTNDTNTTSAAVDADVEFESKRRYFAGRLLLELNFQSRCRGKSTSLPANKPSSIHPSSFYLLTTRALALKMQASARQDQQAGESSSSLSSTWWKGCQGAGDCESVASAPLSSASQRRGNKILNCWLFQPIKNRAPTCCFTSHCCHL